MCVWNSLHDDLLENILVRLTVHDILHVRAVCRRFLTVTSSSKFLHLCSLHPSTKPNLLLLSSFHHLLGSELAYDPYLHAWIPLPLSFLLPFLPPSFYPIASHGGLLCLGSGTHFVLCNPITHSCKQLPPISPLLPMDHGLSLEVNFGEDFQQAFALLRDNLTGFYELLVINTCLDSKSTTIISYTSSTGLWKGHPGLAQTEPRTLHSSSIVACNLSFYSLWKGRASYFVYCFSKGLWSVIEGPILSSKLLSSHLIDRHGCLYMVGGVGSLWLINDTWERPTSMRIWKLDVETTEWVEVLRMPPPVLQEFRLHIEFDHLGCWGKDDIIYMMSPGSQILMYDFCTMRWTWLGKEINTDIELGGIVLEPSLSAAA